jgi:dihydropteroate synthase
MREMKRTDIMAIVNVSPDSFNGDGIADEKTLRKRITQAVTYGADILDIGGQSTRPGAEIITVDEELRRVLPAITLTRRLCDKPISIDTFKPEVAEAAIAAGAMMVNDVHGCEDDKMAEIVRDTGVDVVVMHSRGTPDTMSQLTVYPRGIVTEVIDFFRERTTRLVTQYGIASERIIIDPGIGFAKTATQSFEMTNQLSEFTKLGYRVLYGASQKSFLGRALGHTFDEPIPVSERMTATTVTTTFAILQGADIVRVHDVKVASEARRIVQCIETPAAVGRKFIS